MRHLFDFILVLTFLLDFFSDMIFPFPIFDFPFMVSNDNMHLFFYRELYLLQAGQRDSSMYIYVVFSFCLFSISVSRSWFLFCRVLVVSWRLINFVIAAFLFCTLWITWNSHFVIVTPAVTTLSATIFSECLPLTFASAILLLPCKSFF